MLGDTFGCQEGKMKEIIDTLAKEFRKVSLKDLYNWNFPKNCPLIFQKEITNNFDKNIYVKANMQELLRDKYLDTSYWIIREWGGINSFKQNEKNDQRLKVFHEFISNNKKYEISM